MQTFLGPRRVVRWGLSVLRGARADSRGRGRSSLWDSEAGALGIRVGRGAVMLVSDGKLGRSTRRR